ncbi:hypothetical protein [Thioalkalivibrio sulfidiphilus]|uniref:hypothetical protein n=1 Tax=Thioalkalivibrio sulfidiphilus TaxID=1033854 RepID=UPI00036EB76F|nr:hypothetical protein [Thioalkalivibrio sulfidiphilus]
MGVENTTRYLVEYDPFDEAGYIVASMTESIPFTAEGVLGTYDIALELDSDPVVLEFNSPPEGEDLGTGSITYAPEAGGSYVTEPFEWSVDPDLGVLVLVLDDLGGGFLEVLYIARFGGDDHEFFGVYVAAEVDTNDNEPSFFLDGSPLNANKR